MPAGGPIQAPTAIPISIGKTANMAYQETETDFPQDLQFADRAGPKKAFLSCDIAGFLQ